MRKIAVVLAWLLFVAASVGSRAGVQQGRGDQRFIGSWRLVSIESPTPNASLGDHPVGLIYYDTTGHMAVQIMSNRPRPTWTGRPTPEQAVDAIASYAAYYGTYTVDDAAQTVTHHREGSLTPGAVDFVRKFEFTGDRLILSPVGTGTHLTWERIR